MACNWSLTRFSRDRWAIKFCTISNSSSPPASKPRESWNMNPGLLLNINWRSTLWDPFWRGCQRSGSKHTPCRTSLDGATTARSSCEVDSPHLVRCAKRQARVQSPCFLRNQKFRDPHLSCKPFGGSSSFLHLPDQEWGFESIWTFCVVSYQVMHLLQIYLLQALPWGGRNNSAVVGGEDEGLPTIPLFVP